MSNARKDARELRPEQEATLEPNVSDIALPLVARSGKLEYKAANSNKVEKLDNKLYRGDVGKETRYQWIKILTEEYLRDFHDDSLRIAEMFKEATPDSDLSVTEKGWVRTSALPESAAELRRKAGAERQRRSRANMSPEEAAIWRERQTALQRDRRAAQRAAARALKKVEGSKNCSRLTDWRDLLPRLVGSSKWACSRASSTWRTAFAG